jgi:hypothetical protein
MTAILVVLGLFGGWWLVGLALLSAVRADLSELRVALTAPAVGISVTALVVFLFSEAGAAVDSCAVPIAIALVALSVLVVVLRRPRVHPGALAVGVVCAAGILLVGWPMFSLGFDWLGNGNYDMDYYVLSALDLMRHGLLSGFDHRGFVESRDFATVLTGLHLAGGRPGGDLLLAFLARIAGRPPYAVFMALILALTLSGASAAGALTMQFARRWWAALLGASIYLVAAQATYGSLQQLLGQVLGLCLAAALLALLMRPELHRERVSIVSQVLPAGILGTALVLSYIELVPELALAYLAYVALLAARRELGVAALLRLWLGMAAIALVVLNKYLFTELSYLSHQAGTGLQSAGSVPLFGFVVVPSGLPGVLGLQTLPPGFMAPHLELSIALAALLIVGALLGSLALARRGAATGVVLLVEALLVVVLAVKGNDFGLFKVSMYVQPFLAAAIAIGVSNVRRWWLRWAWAIPLAILALAELSTQHAYVKASQDPANVPNLSASDVIPAFHTLVAHSGRPVVSVTENPVLIGLEAVSAGVRPVYFQSRNVFASLRGTFKGEISPAEEARSGGRLRASPWVKRSFDLHTANGAKDAFELDTSASSSLASERCELVFPSTSEVPFNGYTVSPLAPALIATPCGAEHDLLAFTNSTLGESFYLPTVRQNVSFYQFQGDPYFHGQMVGFGRYALFQVIGSTKGERMVVELTSTLQRDGRNLLPPAAAVGASREPLGLEGHGSARVYSAPLTPQVVDGTPYVLLDMGVNGRLPRTVRTGLEGLYGRSVPTDLRFLTSYVRDISLVSAAEYARVSPPLSISHFPADLENHNLEYSGLYEDGWVGGDSYGRLAGGRAADLLIRAAIPAGAGRHLEVLVNGRSVLSRAVTPGPLEERIAVSASRTTRRVELRFGATVKLKAPDDRPAAALLSFLGFVPRAG